MLQKPRSFKHAVIKSCSVMYSNVLSTSKLTFPMVPCFKQSNGQKLKENITPQKKLKLFYCTKLFNHIEL